MYPAAESRVAAFLDVGTNSIRMLLVRINPNRSFTVLSDQKETVRLGEGEFADGYLQPQAMERAIQVCRQFAEMARASGADPIHAVATSATRDAHNQEEFIRRLKHEANLDVRVISGREEARLIYLGIVNSIHLQDRTALMIDIGGGSTEIILGNNREYHFLDSLKLGSIRLTTTFFLPGETRPVKPARYALLQQFVRNASVRTRQSLANHTFDIVYGSSGTIENLADIAIQMDFKRRRTRDDVLTLDQLTRVIHLLCSLPLEERRRVPGITPARADIIIGGGAILHTLMQDLNIPQIYISDRGLRDGLLIDFLAKGEHADLVSGSSVRERSVLQLARACNFDEAHARKTAALALQLFDSAAESGLLRPNAHTRELLEYAALLHDIGTFLSYSNHQAHTYYLVRNTELLGFNQTEIAIIANIGLFHRKALPKKRKHPQYAALDKQSRKIVRTLAVLLRIAESLDRSHTGVVQRVRLRLAKNAETACLHIYAPHNEAQLELWGAQNHRKAFQKIFKYPLKISVEQP